MDIHSPRVAPNSHLRIAQLNCATLPEADIRDLIKEIGREVWDEVDLLLLNNAVLEYAPPTEDTIDSFGTTRLHHETHSSNKGIPGDVFMLRSTDKSRSGRIKTCVIRDDDFIEALRWFSQESRYKLLPGRIQDKEYRLMAAFLLDRENQLCDWITRADQIADAIPRWNNAVYDFQTFLLRNKLAYFHTWQSNQVMLVSNKSCMHARSALSVCRRTVVDIPKLLKCQKSPLHTSVGFYRDEGELEFPPWTNEEEEMTRT